MLLPTKWVNSHWFIYNSESEDELETRKPEQEAGLMAIMGQSQQ